MRRCKHSVENSRKARKRETIRTDKTSKRNETSTMRKICRFRKKEIHSHGKLNESN